MNNEKQKTEVLAQAEAELAAIDRRIENAKRELSTSNHDREGKRALIKRMHATREEISRAALARIGGVA